MERPEKENMPFCSRMKPKSWLTPRAASFSTSSSRISRIRTRMAVTSSTHSA
ncbi:hypothetical protein D3C80_2036740 [compost metagenome]